MEEAQQYKITVEGTWDQLSDMIRSSKQILADTKDVGQEANTMGRFYATLGFSGKQDPEIDERIKDLTVPEEDESFSHYRARFYSQVLEEKSEEGAATIESETQGHVRLNIFGKDVLSGEWLSIKDRLSGAADKLGNLYLKTCAHNSKLPLINRVIEKVATQGIKQRIGHEHSISGDGSSTPIYRDLFRIETHLESNKYSVTIGADGIYSARGKETAEMLKARFEGEGMQVKYEAVDLN